jgi:hypothetical protein
VQLQTELVECLFSYAASFENSPPLVEAIRHKRNRCFKFEKRRQHLIRTHNEEALAVAAMRVNNEDRPGFRDC